VLPLPGCRKKRQPKNVSERSGASRRRSHAASRRSPRAARGVDAERAHDRPRTRRGSRARPAGRQAPKSIWASANRARRAGSARSVGGDAGLHGAETAPGTVPRVPRQLRGAARSLEQRRPHLESIREVRRDLEGATFRSTSCCCRRRRALLARTRLTNHLQRAVRTGDWLRTSTGSHNRGWRKRLGANFVAATAKDSAEGG